VKDFAVEAQYFASRNEMTEKFTIIPGMGSETQNIAPLQKKAGTQPLRPCQPIVNQKIN
jgi:hypothetical protein